jgi:hypothetical protein
LIRLPQLIPQNPTDNAQNRNGMVVAQWRAIAFVPTKLGRG